MAGHRRFLVALVVQGPYATEVDGMRRALGSRDLERIPPHITLVPPLNVAESAVASAIDLVRHVAEKTASIALVLGPPASFPDRDDVVYLSVDDALGAVGALASELEKAPLLPPTGRHERAFIPHITLVTRLTPERAAAARASLAAYRVEAVFSALVVFEQRDERTRPWVPVGDYALREAVIAGRGGRELTLTMSRDLDPVARRLFEDATDSAARPNEPFALVARDGAAVVGVASGEKSASRWRIAHFVVETSRRNEGIGSALLRELIATAQADGASSLEVIGDGAGEAGSALGAFFSARGFRASDRAVSVVLERGI